MERTIWLYWQGPRPAYIELCYRSVLATNFNVTLLDRAAFDVLYRHDRDLPIDALAPNHQSDFVRAYLLQHYGGLYLDADCVGLRSLAPILDLASRHGFAGYREPQGYMSCNLMAATPGAAVIAAHYASVCAALRSGRQLEWLDLASVPMDAAVAAHPDGAVLLPTHQIMPIPWNESHRLAERRGDAAHAERFETDAFCYMLSNNTIKSHDTTRLLTLLPEEDLLREHYFLSFLLRRAFGRPPREMASTPDHLGGHEDKTQFDDGALAYLAERFGVRRMVDVGCGPGGMLYAARQRGIAAVGVDGDPTIARENPLMIEHDYTRKPLHLGAFDLGWSVEFLEHVEERFLPNVMATFAGCRAVFVTAALPGQPGHYHVNCQPGEYWVARFAEAGFRLDEEATAGVRRHSTMWSRFTEQTGLVFVAERM